jgi:hypothetical protein
LDILFALLVPHLSIRALFVLGTLYLLFANSFIIIQYISSARSNGRDLIASNVDQGSLLLSSWFEWPAPGGGVGMIRSSVVYPIAPLF